MRFYSACHKQAMAQSVSRSSRDLVIPGSTPFLAQFPLFFGSLANQRSQQGYFLISQPSTTQPTKKTRKNIRAAPWLAPAMTLSKRASKGVKKENKTR